MLKCLFLLILKKVTPTVSKELATEFLESITFNEEQAEMINKKTVNQSQSQFWFDQRVGRITASSFYTVPPQTQHRQEKYCEASYELLSNC